MYQMHKFSNNFVLIVYDALFLFLSGFTICTHADVQTHDIYPKATCQNHNECLTLSDVLNERDKYFTSNSMLVFHEGEHLLQEELVSVSNISNFTLQGYGSSGRSSPTITCVSVYNFTLQDYGGGGSGSGLELSGSGSGFTFPRIGSTLSFSDVSIAITSIGFNHCSISLSRAAAVVQDSKFENGSAWSGGALAVRYSSVQFDRTNSFTGNMAELYGGAVYAFRSILTFSGTTVFTGNTAPYGGAVFCVVGTTLSFSGNSIFMKNTEEGPVAVDVPFLDYGGGVVYALYNNTLSFTGNSNFISNTAEHGGAVYAWHTNTLSFNGNSSFLNNTATGWGGAITAYRKNTLSFNGNSRFLSNTAEMRGGAVCALDGNTLSFNGNNSFMGNTAGGGGAVYALVSNTLSFNGNSSFMGNTAKLFGGAVSAFLGITLSFNGNSKFSSNMAKISGGAMYVTFGSSLSIYGSSIFEHNEAAQGGGVALFTLSQLHLSRMTSLLSNTASFGGGAFAKDSSIHSTGNIAVTGNEAIHGGGLFVQSSNVTLQGTGLLAGNTATNRESGYGGAILSLGCIAEFHGSFDITNNTAEFGGGLAIFGLYEGVLIIKNGTNLTFEGNLAHRRGGAIYVEDNPFTFCAFDNAEQHEDCFFQTEDGPYNCFEVQDNNHQANSFILKFASNTANMSGDIMYGGHLESCVVCNLHLLYTMGAEIFHNYAESEVDVFSKLSSDPYKVCICEDGQPNCDLREVNRTVYPGQVLVTSVVAVGQMNGTVPSVIRAVCDDLIGTPDFQETQPAENIKKCSQLQYPLLASGPSTTLKLYSDEPCSTFGFPFTFLIDFLPCPVGFTLSEQGACICDQRLQKYTLNCTIQTLTISRAEGDSFWVGLEGTDELILHPHCPFDYCTEEPVYFPLNSTDVQCANGRSGILCGACQLGQSLALGSSRCLSNCSNTFLALLMAFAFAGVALVAFLFLCHLTVAEGTLSGLIFYANVLVVNQTVFFPSGEQNLLTVFIAWLNLDLGTETCFFASLDAYSRTWLQFAFPIYIWVMVGVIIVFADRSTTFAKIIGNTNPVAVLATLFLLSYTKLLRAIMAAFSFTSLDYPDGNSKYVWLYDGNIGYLDRHDSRHIALFLFSLLFLLFVFLPYTLLLLCGQWIQKQLWWLSSTKQLYLKFFLDAHYGPYRNRHCYWTGLLLMLRFVMLFFATVINIRNPQDPFSNLLVIQVVSLAACCWVSRGIFKKWYHDLLETSFLFNLTVLVGSTYQVRMSGGSQAALVYTSVSIAFLTFLGIVISAVIKRVREKVAEHRRRVIHQLANTVPGDDEEDSVQLVPAAASTSAVTYSVLEIVRHHPDQTSGEIELRPAMGEISDLNT